VREFREFLGDLTGGRTTAEAIERFRRIATAPDDLEALRSDRDVADALTLLAEHGAKPDEQLVRMLGRAALYDASLDTQLLAGKALPTGTNRDLLAALLADSRLAGAVFERLVPHLQKRVLIDRYSS